MQITSLTPLAQDLVKATALTGTHAFVDDPTTVFLIPNPKKRPNLRHAIECYLRLSLLSRNEAYVTSPNCEGVAVWIHSDATSSMLNTLRAGWPWRPLRCGLGYVLRDTRSTLHYEKLRREIAPKPHLYLAVLAVTPEFQGQGFASKLIRPMLARLDAEGLSAYVETQNLRNVAMYEHYGFVLERKDVMPGSDITMYILIRPPTTKEPEDVQPEQDPLPNSNN